MTDLYDRTLEPSGVRLSQLAILSVIRAHGRITMHELATELGLDPSTMTRTLRPLEDGTLVASGAGGDKRARVLELTAAGREKLTQGMRLWQRAQKALREKIGADVFDRLLTDLAEVTRALRR